MTTSFIFPVCVYNYINDINTSGSRQDLIYWIIICYLIQDLFLHIFYILTGLKYSIAMYSLQYKNQKLRSIYVYRTTISRLNKMYIAKSIPSNNTVHIHNNEHNNSLGLYRTKQLSCNKKGWKSLQSHKRGMYK